MSASLDATSPGRLARIAWAMVSVAAIGLAVYLPGTAPTVLYGDSAELQAAALVGGVGHPSGYPMFILLGQLFGKLLGGDPAHRIAVMSAVTGAAGLAALVLVLAEIGLSWQAAVAGALIYGATFTYWWAAIHSEVYALAIVFFLLGLWKTLSALRTRTRSDAGAAAYFLGLTMTAHLAFGPAVLVMLAFLAFKNTPGGWLARWGWIAAGFLLGLSPYIYLAIADRITEATNYLAYTIELSEHQFGLTPESFDAPWERIPWLIFGQESHPTNLLTDPRAMARSALEALAGLFLFEFGPIGLLLFAMGAWWLAVRSGPIRWLLLATVLLTYCFAMALSYGRMLPIFMMAATITVAIGVAAGLEAILARVRSARFGRIAILLAICLIAIPLPHLLRVRSYHQPIGPLEWRATEEGEPRITTVVPRLSGFREPREVGEQLMRTIPANAMVAGEWKHIMVLKYLQTIEGVRPDIALDPFYFPWHLARLRRWQEYRDPSRNPIVMLGRIPPLWPYFEAADSIRAPNFGWLYVLRTPLPAVEGPSNP